MSFCSSCCHAGCACHQDAEREEHFLSKAAIRAMTGIEEKDIIVSSFKNAIHVVPFYAAKVESNGRQKEIIIAIRGTLSIQVKEQP